MLDLRSVFEKVVGERLQGEENKKRSGRLVEGLLGRASVFLLECLSGPQEGTFIGRVQVCCLWSRRHLEAFKCIRLGLEVAP